MSAQTGSAPVGGPVSQRLVDRARFRIGRIEDEPNPVWIRELKQAARLGRTPLVLMIFTILMTMLIATIGGLVSREYSPATTGVVIFQVFFSLAYFVVTVVGPAVAANSIASEREGKTWEAVILTGLPPGTIARGKFLAAFTAIGSYIVMLAPVGALSFLFGGVTATEVLVAFAFLFLIALLSVAFGLAISSKMESLRAAIVVTLLLAFPISVVAFTSFGVGLSVLAHQAWSGVAEGPPVWLPTAYERAPFGINYVVFLIVVPVIAVALPAWFLYEVTIANLTSVTDDRSSGLKKWFLVALPLLAVTASTPAFAAGPREREIFSMLGMAALAVFLTFCVFLFQGDPIGPSRRVLAQWDLAKTGAFRRFLGPGVMRSAKLLLGGGWLGMALVLGGGVVALELVGALKPLEMQKLAVFAGYSFAFYTFVVGFAAFLRSRVSTSIAARLLLLGVLFAIAAVPWVIAAVAGILEGRGGQSQALIIAAPSPFYVFYMLDAIHRKDAGLAVPAGIACAIAWAGMGVVLLGAAQRRARAIIVKHEAVLAETDRLLAAEDEAAFRASQPAAEEPAGEMGVEQVPADASAEPAG